jgi:hypothetical protein
MKADSVTHTHLPDRCDTSTGLVNVFLSADSVTHTHLPDRCDTSTGLVNVFLLFSTKHAGICVSTQRGLGGRGCGYGVSDG